MLLRNDDIQIIDRRTVDRDLRTTMTTDDRRTTPTNGAHGVSIDVSDYHAWLDRVSANLPMPVPMEVTHD